MADDEEVRGASAPEELFAPAGPRRASFTPASNDADTLQAAANLFDDDAIAEALSAELARIASGPIPIQRPAASEPADEPVSEPAVREPVSEPADEPVSEPAVREPVSEPAVHEPFESPAEPAAPESAPKSEPVPVASEPEPEQASEPAVGETPAPVETSTRPEPVALAAEPEPEPASEPEPVTAPEPEPASVAESPAEYAPEPESASEPEPETQPSPEPQAEPDAAQAPEPVASEPPAWGSEASADPEPAQAVETPQVEAQEPEPESEPAVADAPASAAAPQGPPDWATPLFGTPTPAPQDEPTPPAATSDPFAPSAPSFAPSNGPFPPPGDSTPEPDPVSTPFPTTDGSAPGADSETLRALYTAAPAPTVPAADAPPPPGYDTPAPPSATLSAIEELQAQLDERDRDSREYSAWESSMLEVGTPEALDAVDQARAERSGIPSVPAAPPAPPTEEPAAFLPPPAEEPAAFLPPPAEEPAPFFTAPFEEPAAFVPPPADEPSPFFTAPTQEPASFLPAPAEEPVAPAAPPTEVLSPFFTASSEEPAAFLPPPAEEPAAFLPPPAEEPAAFLPPPAEEPAAFLAPPAEEAVNTAPTVEEPVPFLPPPAEEPAGNLATPAEDASPSFFLTTETVPDSEALTPSEPAAAAEPENPFDIFAGIDLPADSAGSPSDDARPFPGFSTPTDSTSTDFEAPADPRELSFDPSSTGAAPPAPERPATVWPLSDSPIPDAPVFLEPTTAPAPAAPASVPSPPGPPSWNLDEFVSAQPSDDEFAAAQPTAEEREAAGAPPALVEPPAHDGVADLWRTASESEPSAPVPASEPTPVVDAPPLAAEAPPVIEPAPPAVGAAATPPPPAAPASGFDDLIVGGSAPDPEPDPQPPSPGWITGDPNPFTEPTIDAATGDRRPFGEGVERDAAVDPSQSIFGSPREPVRADTAGMAAAPEYVVVEPQPIRIPRLAEDTAAVALVAPRITPAEPAGLQPTPAEQRIGRASRLFWLWFAANSSIAAIVFGTILFALGVSLRQAVVATLAGVALSFLPLGLGTLAGKRSGQPTMVISRATFGVVGNILPALIALVSRLFWAAGLLWVLGAGTADILHGAQLTDGFTVGELTIIVIALGFIVAVVIAYFGYALMARVQLVVSVISGIGIVGFIALTIKYVDLTTALSTQDGPWILVVTGAVLVFSFVGLAWANSSADVARYQRPGSSGAASMLWATFGVALPSFILIAYGALLAASNATLAANIAADPLDSLARLLPVWYPGPLLAATGLSLLSGIVLAFYSGGFALQAAGLRLRRSLSTLLVGVLTVIMAVIMANALTDFSQLFRDLATTVAVPIAAWAGIFGSEIMIRKRRFDSYSLLNRGGAYADARWGNIVALLVISAIGYGFLSATMPGLAWQGYLFSALGVPLAGQLAGSDLGVLVALVLGLAFPLIAGREAVRAQEKAERVAE